MNIFTASIETISSCFGAVASAARSAEKSIVYIETELDIMKDQQSVRIEKARLELAAPVEKPLLEQQ